MSVRGQVVVVTGAGRGIGQAIAAKLAGEGARVVVNDLDGELAENVAAGLGGIAVGGDAATETGVEMLIETAERRVGPIDVFFGNAGVPGLGDVTAEDAIWMHTLEVNLLAHVRAARILVPRWLERGGGRLVITASAAGLLTMPGAAPYAASKHAAVAFAEWLSLTYGQRGVVVQCLCPQGVDTQMLEQMGSHGRAAVQNEALTADEVAEEVWRALDDDRMLILPHPQVRRYYRNRAEDTERWIRGMRTLLS
jgi:NAD(P)-dependent dehydrogenase (short-subunit alcohol dehydrogenase family)